MTRTPWRVRSKARRKGARGAWVFTMQETDMIRSPILPLAAAALLGLAPAAGAQTTLVVSAYAASVDQYRKDLYDPFERQCGCKVVLDLGNSAERLTKLDARKDNPNVDVAVLTNFNALEAARKG